MITLAEKVIKITKGMANAVKSDKECPYCRMKIAKYPGRYPKKCPDCGGLLKEDPLIAALGG